MEITSANSNFAEISKGSSEFCTLLEFLVRMKNFIKSSFSTEFDIEMMNDSMSSLTVEESESGEKLPSFVLWKCFDQVGILKKVEKYVRLLLELFIVKIEENKDDFQKLMEWYNRFIVLKDCILIFCLEEEYVDKLVPTMKSFVGLVLKKLQRMESTTYPKEIYSHNLLARVVAELFQCRILMNAVLEEILKNLQYLIDIIDRQKSTRFSELTLNLTECLNRYFNILEVMDVQKWQKIESKHVEELTILSNKIIKIDVFPKHFHIRVLKMIDFLK